MKGTDADEYRLRMSKRVHPFIGHEGISSRISVEKKTDRLVLKESRFSQLLVLFPLLLFGPGLTALMVAKREDVEFVRTPWPILVILAVFSLIGWLFGAKYAFRLFAGRRIEVSGNERTVSEYAQGHRLQRKVAREDINGFDIISTWFHGDSDWVENFTLRLKCRDGGTIELCTSDSRDNIESVKSLVERMIP